MLSCTIMQVVKETIELMKSLRATMHENWDTLEVEKIQPRWCCGEYPYLFRGASIVSRAHGASRRGS